jgi:hypothetical protein
VRQAIGDVVPFAAVVMVSPLNVIAAILLLFPRRSIGGAVAYLAGFAAGVGSVVIVFDAIAERADWSAGSGPSTAPGVAAPIVVALALGDGSTRVLESWRGWLVRNNDTVLATLYLVFAAVLLGNGIATV